MKTKKWKIVTENEPSSTNPWSLIFFK